MSTAEEQHQHHIIGGHKATLNNPSSGEEAKERSRQYLKEAGIEVSEVDGKASFSEHKVPKHEGHHDTRGHVHPDEKEGDEAHRHRVIGGYKATLSNDSTSEEAKQHAREKLREAGEDY